MRHETSDSTDRDEVKKIEARGVTSIKSDRDEILVDLKVLDNKRGETRPRWMIPMLHGLTRTNEESYTSRLIQLQGSLPGFPGQGELVGGSRNLAIILDDWKVIRTGIRDDQVPVWMLGPVPVLQARFLANCTSTESQSIPRIRKKQLKIKRTRNLG